MNLYPVETGNFKLDGGAMFGVVPKAIWNKTNPADSNNLCNWAMRSLLIEDGNRLILVDTGIGDKQNEKFFNHFHLNVDSNLDSSLDKLGFHSSDITDVLLTHLHFDHVGGAVYRKNGQYKLKFSNAKTNSNTNCAFADFRYEKKKRNSPSKLIFAAIYCYPPELALI